MKTAMQELLDELKSHGIEHSEVYIKELLEKEKQQIIEACKHGANYDNSPYKNAEEYYEKQFKN